MRVYVVGAILGVIFQNKDRGVFPIGTVRNSFDHAAEGQVIVGNGGCRARQIGRVLFNLDVAREWIKKFDYAILVEGQMDCISVYAAGFHNVIASSGTAFTELQAKLMGRFSKNVVVNFDPDTAGAKATERTLGLLVEEEFQIKVLTLEQGFDPDLYIRRKGKEAYGAALKTSQKYFDYLIERARTQFPVRSAEGKV